MTESFKTEWRKRRKEEVKFYLQMVLIAAESHILFKALTKQLDLKFKAMTKELNLKNN